MQIYDDKVFKNPIDKIVAFNNGDFIKAIKKIEQYKKECFYLLGYIRYNAKDIFLEKEITSNKPLLYFEVFKNYENFKRKDIKNINIKNEALISYTQYENSFKKIKDYISRGYTYEVNYTYPYKVYSDKNNIDLYNYLLKNQKTPYNALIQNEWEEVLSFSPELFFKIKNNKITTKPMKGTIKRGETEKEDIENYQFLQNDDKNRAENVMIVDLLRNDLSKISKTGTVKVDKLFEIEKHKTLYQMTSQISATLEDNINLYDILKAIYPCGSITGAPKISTMEIIDELEYFNREIYCGTIGYITNEETIFSVPIRILQKDREDDYYKYFVGGAIVWDSEASDEWEETLTKKKILDCEINYNLIETMLIENNEIKLLDYHKKRLKKSAEILGFKYNEKIFNLDCSKEGCVRIELSKCGEYKIEYKKIIEKKSNKIRLSKNKLNSKNKYLYHKTTFRPWYKNNREEYFDIIYTNEKNELTEGQISNIVIQKNNKCYTPKVECGLLNGCLRQYLLDNKKIEEKILTEKDLISADKIYCINSLRGITEVEYDSH